MQFDGTRDSIEGAMNQVQIDSPFFLLSECGKIGMSLRNLERNREEEGWKTKIRINMKRYVMSAEDQRV